MRVTHIITRLIVGGAQENTVSSVLGLHRRHQLDIDLISGPSDGPEGSLEPEFQAFPGMLHLARHLVRPVHPWHDWRALAELTAMLRRRQPDLVHTHSGKAGVLGRIAAARAGVPCVVHTIHGPSFGPFQGRLANALFLGAERHAARFTTHFVSVAHAMTRQYLEAGIGRPEQYTRILSGFPIQSFLDARPDPALRARLGLAPDDFVITKIARLAPLKGHEDLMAVAPLLIARQPRVRFLLLGDGPLRGRLERQARAAGCASHVHFAGLVPPADIPGWIALSDAVVHLSRREGLPRAVSQSMAAGKPVIAYDCDGAGEICRTDETGFLLRPGDREELTRRLEQLATDPALGRRLGAEGRRVVQHDFTVERMVDDLQSLYERLRGR